MMSDRGVAASLVFLCFTACGGGGKKVKEPKVEKPVVEAPKPETEAQREAKRAAARLAMVPDGSNCLPASLKEQGAPQLELASVGADAILCAVDTDPTRLLGDVACWKVDLKNMGDGKVPLIYQPAAPQPGHDVVAKIVAGCALGFCSPKLEKTASATVAHLSWSSDGAKVAMLAGTDVHLFDAATKSHASTFGIAGDKGVTGTATAIHLVADSVVVEAAPQGSDDANAFVFKLDGTATGPVMALGGKDEKPLSLKKGSFSVLDPMKIAIADHGMDTFTEYEIASGKRTKSVRKPAKLPCKPAEVDAYWNDGDKVTDKCKDALAKYSGAWIGASAVMGSHSLLFALKGDRLGELAIVDPKSLAETKKALKLPWCGDDAPADNAAPKSKSSSRAPVKKGGDPEDGGE